MTRRTLAILAGSAAAIAAAVPATAEVFNLEFGGVGTGPGKFGTGVSVIGGNRQYDDPGGIAFDRSGNLLVADPSNHRIQRFNQNGQYLGEFGRLGTDSGATPDPARGRMNLPEGIAVDRKGYIYVGEHRNHRLTRWSSAGRYSKRIAARGNLPGKLLGPWGVAVTSKYIYVVNQLMFEVARYSLSGKYLGHFGKFDNTGQGTRGEFRYPYDVKVESNGNVLVSDSRRNIINRYSSTGKFKNSLFPNTRKTTGIAVGPGGTIYVSDYCNRRVVKIAPNGQIVGEFGQGTLIAPTFLAVASNGTVFVSDYHRVVRFAPGAQKAADKQGHRIASPTPPDDGQCAGPREPDPAQ
jgi:sugar lactone lactonase YvrE